MTEAFIIGPPKTGTTLLSRLIDQHPDVTCLHESYLMQPGHYDSIAFPGSRKAMWHGFTEEQSKRWHSMLLNADDLKPPVQAILTEAWDKLRADTGASICVDSWPFWIGWLKTITRAFPDAKLIYTARDPRAVYWSMHTFDDREFGSGALKSLLEQDEYICEYISEGGDVLVVRYEDLVIDPLAVMQVVWRHIGADPLKGWLEYKPECDRWPERWSWIKNATEAVDHTRMDRWAREMPPVLQRGITIRAKKYCNRYGYRTDVAKHAPNTLGRFMAGDSALTAVKEAADTGEMDAVKLALMRAVEVETIIRHETVYMARMITLALQLFADAIEAMGEQAEAMFTVVSSAKQRLAKHYIAHGLSIAARMMGDAHNWLLYNLGRNTHEDPGEAQAHADRVSKDSDAEDAVQRDGDPEPPP